MADFGTRAASPILVGESLDCDDELRLEIPEVIAWLTVKEAKALRRHIKTVLTEAGY